MTEQYTVTIQQKGTTREVSEEGHLNEWVMRDALRVAHQTLSEVRERIIHVTVSIWDRGNYQIRYE